MFKSLVPALTEHRQVAEERCLRFFNKDIVNNVSVIKYT